MPQELDLHIAVSNQPEGLLTAVPGRPRLEGPSPGSEGLAPGGSDEGVEAVDGFRLPTAVPPAPDESLRDIGEASFGPPAAPETVHGPDDRVQITNTDVYPWRVHCFLEITAADGSRWIGTGWFLGPHTIATAGHVVFIKNSGVAGRDGWVRSITVWAGRNGGSAPYGSVTSTDFRSVNGWTANGDENYDYGAIILPNDLGSTTGWFGFGVWSDADLVASVGNIAGYPGDKPYGTLWYDARKIDSVGPRKVYYDIDTYGGQSGSAVYRIINGSDRYGVAIHAYGGATVNSGTRITTPVYDNYVAWKA
ncbi:trypsin-like serine peptidase [Streptomyces paludis]|uniref:Serine protease n=1 Tax=Streptomyces paludis TaxID=2282738 RepID=A0A345HSE8_9ACTN|nr:endopeptidase [Streptomyces paludis]AXG79622.1 endopeptidase [Streptomyces paludis]